MNTIDKRIIIPAPPQVVWNYISDLERNPEWQIDCREVAFLTTRHEGPNTRWRYTTDRGRDYVVEAIHWYNTLGYEYTFVDGPYKENSGRIRLQEIPEGTVVQWTFSYQMGGMLRRSNNRQLETVMSESLKMLWRQIKQITGGEEFADSKSLIREAPDVEARSQYKPRHPSAVSDRLRGAPADEREYTFNSVSDFRTREDDDQADEAMLPPEPAAPEPITPEPSAEQPPIVGSPPAPPEPIYAPPIMEAPPADVTDAPPTPPYAPLDLTEEPPMAVDDTRERPPVVAAQTPGPTPFEPVEEPDFLDRLVDEPDFLAEIEAEAAAPSDSLPFDDLLAADDAPLIAEPPVAQDDTRPRPAVVDVQPTASEPNVEEWDLPRPAPTLSESPADVAPAAPIPPPDASPPPPDALQPIAPIAPAEAREVPPEPEATEAAPPSITATDSASIWEVFGVPRPSETKETSPAEPVDQSTEALEASEELPTTSAIVRPPQAEHSAAAPDQSAAPDQPMTGHMGLRALRRRRLVRVRRLH
ncbi:MAG: hypothetical protein GYB67_18975 [Chloroflexi bacterium]|nr:hypothetical protein [Chloroflexota bacterium]